MFAMIAMMTSIWGCAVQVNVDGIVSDGCAWTSDMYLTEASIKALRDAQKDHPEVRVDREKIVTHNKLYQENCVDNIKK